MKTFVIGDIQGGYKALVQCLERSKFRSHSDHLIVLGDVCDGWPETKQCIDLLLRIKNCTFVVGNHDEWFLQWATEPREPAWDTQGGRATFHSYVPKEHIDFIKYGHLWHVDEERNALFVHGGIDSNQKYLERQDKDTFLWDRELLRIAIDKNKNKPDFKFGIWNEIYIGHTSIKSWGFEVPTKFCNVWAMDTGGGWEWKLSIMDVDSKTYWQSDIVAELYPKHAGRFENP